MDNLPDKLEDRLPISKEQVAHRMELAKSRSLIPFLEATADEIEMRARSGKLAKEIGKQKISSIIHNFTKILAALKSSAVVVIGSRPAAGDDKPPEWFKMHAVSDMTDGDRLRLRRQVLKGELADGQEIKHPESDKKTGSPDGESQEGGSNEGRQDLPPMAGDQGARQ